MLKTIIFSKNRPLQLHLALSSLFQNMAIDNKVNVIYSYSNNEYYQAYKHLSSEFKNIEFKCENIYNGFDNCLRQVLNETDDKKFLMFLTDDNIVYRKCLFTEEDIRSVFDNEFKICTLSLRMGLNISDRDGYKVPIPNITKHSRLMFIWNRMNSLAGDYWNYPLSVDGHIFKIETIQNIVNDITKDIKNPNYFEQILQRYFFEVGPFMAAPMLSNVVNSPNNRVQDYIQNWFGRVFKVSSEELLYKFNEGARVNLDKLNFDKIVCPHQEINILEGL